MITDSHSRPSRKPVVISLQPDALNTPADEASATGGIAPCQPVDGSRRSSPWYHETGHHTARGLVSAVGKSPSYASNSKTMSPDKGGRFGQSPYMFRSHPSSPMSIANSPKNSTNTNVFIRNLAPEVEQSVLNDLFGKYGTILSSAIMRNIHTGVSLGTAFVRFETHEQAKAAIIHLNDYELAGKAVMVQWAKKRDGAPVGEARERIHKLFVRNVPLDINVDDLTEFFSAFGPVKQVSIHRDTAPVPDGCTERRISFVVYGVDGAADKAAEAVHNTKPFASCNGVPLMVKLAEDSYNKFERRGFCNGGSESNGNSPYGGAGPNGWRSQHRTSFSQVNSRSTMFSTCAPPLAYGGGSSSDVNTPHPATAQFTNTSDYSTQHIPERSTSHSTIVSQRTIISPQGHPQTVQQCANTINVSPCYAPSPIVEVSPLGTLDYGGAIPVDQSCIYTCENGMYDTQLAGGEGMSCMQNASSVSIGTTQMSSDGYYAAAQPPVTPLQLTPVSMLYTVSAPPNQVVGHKPLLAIPRSMQYNMSAGQTSSQLHSAADLQNITSQSYSLPQQALQQQQQPSSFIAPMYEYNYIPKTNELTETVFANSTPTTQSGRQTSLSSCTPSYRHNPYSFSATVIDS